MHRGQREVEGAAATGKKGRDGHDLGTSAGATRNRGGLWRSGPAAYRAALAEIGGRREPRKAAAAHEFLEVADGFIFRASSWAWSARFLADRLLIF
jgi:hypothetical protein